MQIIQLELSHDNFFCPATGQRITGPQSYEASPAQVGMWIGEIITEPEIASPELDAQWTRYEEQLSDDGGVDIENFLRSLNMPNHVCFEITTSGMACGPVSSSVWYVINMDTAESSSSQ
jgi:hypothetical protein